MAIKKDIQIDRRVAIAMDALSPVQNAAVKPMLQNKEQFLTYAKRPGAIRKLSDSKGLYVMRAGSDMRIVFESKDDAIVVRDLMHKTTMDGYLKRKGKTSSVKNAGSAAKRNGTKIPKA